jgi:hypothetical protein
MGQNGKQEKSSNISTYGNVTVSQHSSKQVIYAKNIFKKEPG